MRSSEDSLRGVKMTDHVRTGDSCRIKLYGRRLLLSKCRLPSIFLLAVRHLKFSCTAAPAIQQPGEKKTFPSLKYEVDLAKIASTAKE